MTSAPSKPSAGKPAVGKPRQRRKDARPGEIIEAAITVFCEQGYGAARLEDVARRAGVAKGTVFVYFPTKPDLFRAVARSLLEANLLRLQALAPPEDTSAPEFIGALLSLAAHAGDTRVIAIARLMIAESRTFPDLAQLWYDEVVSKMLGIMMATIARAQARGEIQPGDPQLYALSILGPMLMGLLFREVLGETGAPVPDLHALAEQHARVVLHGLEGPKASTP